MDPDDADAATRDPGIASVADSSSGRADVAARMAAVRGRLLSPMPDDGIWGWAGPLLVTAFAAIFRFNRLSVPHAVVFDETYYVKDAWSILKHGVEWNMVANPAGYPAGSSYVNTLMLAGHTNIFAACSGTRSAEYILQPDAAKYLMAVGEWLFGLTPLGWRGAPARFRSLAVPVLFPG